MILFHINIYLSSCTAVSTGESFYFNIGVAGNIGLKLSHAITADAWQHGCITVTNTSISWLASNTAGEINKSMFSMSINHQSLNPNFRIPTVRLGSNPKYLQLTGQISQFSLFLEEITIDIQQNLSRCQEPEMNQASLTPSGRFTNVKERKVLNSLMCEPDPQEIIRTFWGSNVGAGQKYSEKYCQNAGGRLLNMSESDRKELQRQTSLQFDTNQPTLRVRVFNNDTASDNCYVFEIAFSGDNGSNTVEIKKADCNEMIFVISCAIPRKNKYRFSIDGMFDLELESQEHGSKLVFANKQCYRIDIFFYLSSTVMINILGFEKNGKKMLVLDNKSADNDIVGRKMWVSRDKNATSLASLSACQSTTMFTCNNGECIPLELRCNGEHDCGDLTDEGSVNGCYVMLPPPSSYKKEMCPSRLTVIDLVIDRAQVQNINMITNKVLVAMEIKIIWQIDQLTFMFLNNKPYRVLSDEDVQQIWVPHISISNSFPDDQIVYGSDRGVIVEFAVQENGDPHLQDYKGYEGKSHNNAYSF